MSTVVLLHGYGVRGSFWRYLRPALETRFAGVHTPDLDLSSTQVMIDSTAEFCRKLALEAGPLLVVGHSLGGIVAALTAQRLGSESIRGVVIVASPYGRQKINKLNAAIMRFLIRFRLIPERLAMLRFFSSSSPVERRKALFADVVQESPELQKELFAPTLFHTQLIQGPLEPRCLVIASEADKVVPAAKTREFADVLRSQLRVFPRSEGVAHDDFAAAPALIEQLVNILEQFAAELSSGESPD